MIGKIMPLQVKWKIHEDTEKKALTPVYVDVQENKAIYNANSRSKVLEIYMYQYLHRSKANSWHGLCVKSATRWRPMEIYSDT